MALNIIFGVFMFYSLASFD